MAKKENKVKKHFFKDFKAELKKVIWPTPKQLVNNTVAVVTIVLIAAIIVFVLDVAFDSINKYGISNLQSIVEENFKEEETKTENNSEEEQKQEESNNNEENVNNEENNNNEEENKPEEQNVEATLSTGEENTEGKDVNPEQ